MKAVQLALLVTIAAASVHARAYSPCNFRAQKVAQQLAQLNGMKGEAMESRYTDGPIYTVVVDHAAIYLIIAAATENSCLIKSVQLVQP